MAINQRKVGTILSYVYIFVSNTISLFYTPIFLGMLGQAEYGLIGTANSLTSYLSLLSMGIGGSYIRFNAIARTKEDKTEEYRVNGMFQLIFIVISGVTLIVGAVLVICSSYIFSQNYTATELAEIRWIIICLVLQFVVTFMFNTTAMALQAYEKFIFIRVCLLISSCLQPVINILALYFGGNAVTISVISLSISFITYLMYYLYAKKAINLKFHFGNYDKVLFKSIFMFSGFLFLNTITDQITFSTDNIVLGIVSGPIAVAVYTVGANFKTYFISFSTAISSVFAPQINQIVANKEDNRKLNDVFIRVGRVQFYVVSLILTGYIFLGRQFITLWVGKEYNESYMIGLLLILAVTVPCFQNVGLEIQKAKNMHKARSVVYFLIALVNVGLTIPFSMLWKGTGAALATLICMFCGTVIFMNLYNQRKVGIDIVGFWKSILRILPGLIIPCAVGYLISRFILIDSYVKLLLFILIYFVVFFISVWFISMNTYEKDLLRKPLKKLINKFYKRNKQNN